MTAAINLIGPGRAGRSLIAVLARESACLLQDVLARPSSSPPPAFPADVRVVRDVAAMRPAQIWLIATPDAAIADVAAALAAARILRAGDIVWHCSGALSSAELAPVREAGALVASVHPLKSFADPAVAVQTFVGTWCTAEGDEPALAVLLPLFIAAGAQVARIDPAGKTFYHAGAVLACNTLTALMEAALRSFERAGLSRDTAMTMMAPLVRETLDNVFRLGTATALTGPVARGDADVVEQQLAALRLADGDVAEAYRTLSVIALDLAKARRGVTDSAETRLREILKINNKNK